MKKITKKEIENYMLFIKSLQINVASGLKFSTRALYHQYGVSHNTTSAMRSLGYIDFNGMGANIKYEFKINNFEPYHVRKIIEYMHEYYVVKYNEIKNKSKGNESLKDAYHVPDYIKFMKLLKFNIDNNYGFKVSDLIKQCNVNRDVTTHMKKCGYLDFKGLGSNIIYKFNISKIEPEYARNVIYSIQKVKAEQKRVLSIINRGYIKNEEENDFIVSIIDTLMDAEKDTPESERLIILSKLVEKFEEATYPFPDPKTEDIIQHNIEQLGMNPKEAVDKALKEEFPAINELSVSDNRLIKVVSETSRIGLFKTKTTTNYYYINK